LSFSQRLQDVRNGFDRPFWVANITEIFERFSYYAVFASLVPYLINNLHFPTDVATKLGGLFGGTVWILAAFGGGAVADRLGFRRALSTAYFILTCAYFMIGSIGASWLAPIREAIPAQWLCGFILLLPALGIALVKPSVVGTCARSSKENVRSIGYSIYYTMVNIGSTIGPLAVGYINDHMKVESVFMIAAGSQLLMFIAVLIFYKEPRGESDAGVATFSQMLGNIGTVLSNPKFMVFLLIFSGYWIVFWQQYLTLTEYMKRYGDATANMGYVLATDPLIVITCTMVVTAMTKKIPAFSAIILGSLLTSVGWLAIAFRPTVSMAIVALAIVAFGEIVMSPRYYEYISRLAPAGQQGTYMGFSFLPIGIGSIIGGWISGKMLDHYGKEVQQPAQFWYAIVGIGLLTTALLFIYDRIVKPTQAVPTT